MTDQKGLAARHLILFFLAGVAVCGVFFALGFLVGYNQRPAGAQVETERLVSSGAVPPTVNPPPDGQKPAGEEAAAAPSGSAGAPRSGERSQPEARPRQRTGVPTPEVSETDIEDGPSSAARPAGPQNGQGSKAMAAGLAIQVIASSSRQDAATLVDVLKTRGYSAFLVTPEEAHLGDKLYRVEVGPFNSREQAEKVKQKLVDQGFKPFIRR